MKIDDYHGRVLSPETLEQLGVIDSLHCFFGKLNTNLVTNPEDKEFLDKTIELYLEHEASRRTCQECPKTKFRICGKHYHDYIECIAPHCLPCLLLRSGQAGPNGAKFHD